MAAPMPPEGAPVQAAPDGQEGGDVGQAIAAVGQALEELASQMPELGEVADHFRQVVEQQMGGGAKPEAPAGPVSPEQGGSNAKPMSMGG